MFLRCWRVKCSCCPCWSVLFSPGLSWGFQVLAVHFFAGVRSARWQLRPPLTCHSARAIAYPGPESFSFQSDALQLLCVCRGGNMDINMRPRPCQNEVSRKVARKGAWLSETVNNPCQTRGASVDILSLNFDFSSVFVFPFLRCQKWHVYPGAQEDVPKQVFLEYKPTLDNSGVRATSCATSHSYCRLLYSFKTLGFPRLLMGHQNTLHQRPVKNFLRHNRFDRWLFELNKAHTPSLLYRSWELRMCRVIFHNAGKV